MQSYTLKIKTSQLFTTILYRPCMTVALRLLEITSKPYAYFIQSKSFLQFYCALNYNEKKQNNQSFN